MEHDEAMVALKNNSRARIRVLEGRMAELEGQLEEDTEKRTEAEKVNWEMADNSKLFGAFFMWFLLVVFGIS